MNYCHLYIITYDYPFGNGETFLETEIEYAAKQFKKITVISTSGNICQTREVPYNVEVVKLSRNSNIIACAIYAISKFFSQEALIEFKRSRSLEYVPNLVELLKAWIITWMLEKRYLIYFDKFKEENMVIYSYWLASGAYFAARWKEKHSNVFAISRAHGFEVRDFESYIPFRVTIDKNLDEILFISKYTQNAYNRIMKPIKRDERRANQVVIQLGVKNHSEQIQYKNETISDIFNIVTCSTIHKLKRLDLIVEALSLLPNNIKISWTHFGWGLEGDFIKDLCEKTLGSNIKWKFTGMVSNEQVMSYYRKNKVDLFINASDNEGIPVSIMEAMSFGIPCIARNVGGNSEIVKDGISGFLLPEKASAKAIADKIEYCFHMKQRPELYDELRNRTLDFFDKNYNADKNYEIFYSRLMELINDKQ